jgi:hypothetical protein
MTRSRWRRRGATRRRPARGDPSPGAVTAEVAAALPALVVVVIAAVWVVSIALAQMRCADAAREAARAAARGDETSVVVDVAKAIASDDARVRVRVEGDLVTVEVSARIPVPIPFGDGLPAPTVHATAAAVMEQP